MWNRLFLWLQSRNHVHKNRNFARQVVEVQTSANNNAFSWEEMAIKIDDAFDVSPMFLEQTGFPR